MTVTQLAVRSAATLVSPFQPPWWTECDIPLTLFCNRSFLSCSRRKTSTWVWQDTVDVHCIAGSSKITGTSNSSLTVCCRWLKRSNIRRSLEFKCAMVVRFFLNGLCVVCRRLRRMLYFHDVVLLIPDTTCYWCCLNKFPEGATSWHYRQITTDRIWPFLVS